MPFLILFGALLVPRFIIAVLYFFTRWFTGVFESMLIPIIGFIGFPYALLAYSVVMNMFSGVWNPLSYVIMIVAVLADLGSWWSSNSGWSGDREI